MNNPKNPTKHIYIYQHEQSQIPTKNICQHEQSQKPTIHIYIYINMNNPVAKSYIQRVILVKSAWASKYIDWVVPRCRNHVHREIFLAKKRYIYRGARLLCHFVLPVWYILAPVTGTLDTRREYAVVTAGPGGGARRPSPDVQLALRCFWEIIIRP